MNSANAALAMPYPGLRPFEAEDQPLFFGREAQVSAMLRQLEDHRFVVVVGSSGSGKSSLVRAGLLPAVREGFLLGTTDWLTIIIKPGHQPYERLLRALHRVTSRTKDTHSVGADDGALTSDETATITTLRRTDRGLMTVLSQLAISPASKVMIVVDQFEELFAFRRAGVNRDTVTSRDEAAAFVGMLLRSASESAGRVWIILTMRSDFIGDCEAFLGLPEQISRSQFLVPRLDRREMEEAIARPAAVEEGTFTTFTFEEGLVNRIINDAGDRPDQLPLMQHALMRTWKHAVTRAGADGHVIVVPKDYEAAGGIEMALSLHADAAWDEIKDDPKKAALARRLFLLLCDISPDGQITRRRPQVTDIQAVTGASVPEIEEIVRVFQKDDRNFLLPPPPQPLTPESYLDISHEALLRQWRLFAGEWQEQERGDASELRRLAELASLRKQGQDVGLLPAQDLERIARWRERVSPEWARRYVNAEAWAEAISFVEESGQQVKREEEQRQKQAQQKKVLVQSVAIVLIVATTVSMVAMLRALNSEKKAKISEREAQISAATSKEAQAAAQEALTRSFVRTIGVSDQITGLTPGDRAALWELAELDRANTPVREKVIDDWFQTVESIGRAFKRQAQGLHAAVGLNLALRDHSALKATELANRLAKALENSQQTDFYVVSTLAALARLMEPKDAASVAHRVTKALENPQQTNSNVLLRLGQALAALAPRMEPKDAASVADRMAKAMENPQQTNSDVLSSLGQALVALAPRMEPKDAASVADRMAKAMESPQQTNSNVLSSLGQALVALAPRMEPKDAASVADRVAKAMESPQQTNSNVLSSLGQALAALAPRMEPKDAASVADRMAKAMENSQQTDSPVLSNLGYALAALAARMESKEAAASVATRGAQALAKVLDNKKTNADVVLSLGQALAKLAARMEPKGATSVADRVAKAMENSQQTDSPVLSSLGQALAALAARMEPKEAAASVATRGAQALAKVLDNKKTNADVVLSLGQALAKLAARMEPKGAASVAQALARALETKQTNRYALSSFGQMLAELAARMEPKQAASLADGVAKAMENSNETFGDRKSILKQGVAAYMVESEKRTAYGERLSTWGHVLAALAARMEPKQAASGAVRGAQVLAKAMENSKEDDGDVVSSWGKPLAALAARMEPKQVASVADRLAKALENLLQTSSNALASTDVRPHLAQALAALAARMEPREAASVANRLAKALENSKHTNSDVLSRLGEALAALAARMESKDAASLADRLAKALENSQETNSEVLSPLGQALAALAARMEPKEAASVAARGAQVLAIALENSQEIDVRRLSNLGWSLGSLARLIPSARRTQLVGLSNMLLEEISDPLEQSEDESEQSEDESEQSEDEPDKRKQLADSCALLDAQDLANVLKWPFCVGGAEKIALAEVEKKKGGKFGGDIWKFVEQAPSLGVKDLDAPATRPEVEDALEELELVATGGEVPRSSGGK